MSEPRNPGWAGETGQFEGLSESDVRGTAYVGTRPLEGRAAGAAPSYPYQLAERDPDAPLFEGPYRERLEKILSRYPDARGALLPVLNMAQEVRGHVSPETMDEVAEILGLAPAAVRGVATFYTMYNRRPVGRYLIQVCTNVSCNLCGADDVAARFLEETGTAPGEVSEDGQFTVIEAECLGACGFPTVVQINNRYFENVEVDAVPGILERLRSDGLTTPQGGATGNGAGGGSNVGARGGSNAGAGAQGTGTSDPPAAEDTRPTPGAGDVERLGDLPAEGA
ncbi:MAG TPA: NAD(P)H-dependent oxidoreductase subunit E [Longimicrobiales bacterium]|nr:NAD(P)H-dependent oxidoreductase subunit E [Longimicrobiales bacterium]